jgi:tetratricopeptide (TPR) repeat protein
LAADVRRYLEDEPVQACPPSAGYRFRKFARRNKVALVTAGVVVAALLIGTAVSVWQAVEANAARNLAGEREENERQARLEAEAHFQKALDAVKRMLFVVGDEQVAAIPKMEAMRQRLLDDALAFYTDLIASNPRHSQVYVERALLYYTNGNLERAIDDYKKAIACDPENAEAHSMLGNLLGSNVQGEKDEIVLPHFRRALELQPTSPGCYYQLGHYYWRTGRPKEAAAAFRKAAELLPPGSVDAYFNLGEAALAVGDHPVARENFEKCLSIAPLKVEAHWHLGESHVALGEFDRAVAAFTKGLDCPRLPGWIATKMLTRRGAIYVNQKNYAAAASDFNRAIKLQPYNAEVHNRLAWGLATWPDVKLRDPGQAVALAKKADELDPNSGIVTNTLGVAQYRNGDWKAAVEALMKAVHLRRGGNSEDFFFLAMAHWQLGEKDKARAWYDHAVAWMDQHKPNDEELKRFRAEATALLGPAKAADTQKKKD